MTSIKSKLCNSDPSKESKEIDIFLETRYNISL